uniref:Aspartate kinase n=1 Tax=Panagrellus redivivus TaxID=6233 RepID=A0A7E4VS51_PANRE
VMNPKNINGVVDAMKSILFISTHIEDNVFVSSTMVPAYQIVMSNKDYDAILDAVAIMFEKKK